MIAAHLIRAIVLSGLLGLAATLMEFALSALGLSRRFVWLAALMLSVLIPAAVLATSRFAATTNAARTASSDPAKTARASIAAPLQSDKAAESSAARMDIEPFAIGFRSVTVPAWLSVFDRPLVLLWAASSLLWAAILIGSAIRIHRNRASWRETTLEGVPVYLSHDTGPALFGIARYCIVVPAWVERLESEHRRLIVAHEREHARAGDPITLLAGALLVLLQPLNPAAWMMFRRMRLAIEMDCDARVLAHHGNVRAYGDLLLDVGERTLAGPAPMAALAEGGSQLSHRIAAMSKPKRRLSLIRMAVCASAIAVVGVGVWQLPQPELAGAAPASDISHEPVGTQQTGRAIVRVNSFGLHDAAARPEILVWAAGGPVQYAVATDTLVPLRDTLRLPWLPPMRFDVTDGSAVVRVQNGGTISLGASVEGDTATNFSATAKQVVLLRGGRGVGSGDSLPRAIPAESDVNTVPLEVLARVVRDRFPGTLDGPVGRNTFVWLLLDRDHHVLESNRGLPSGMTSIPVMVTGTVSQMLPRMTPQLRRGESWGWNHLPSAGGGSLNVIWMRQLYPVGAGPGEGGRP